VDMTHTWRATGGYIHQLEYTHKERIYCSEP
jgi:hypothetical protein